MSAAEIANVLIGIAALITAVVVPLFSIRLANFEAKRRDTRNLLLKVNADVQGFRIAVLGCHPGSIRVPVASPEQAISRADQGTQAIQNAITALNSDRLAIGLQFGGESDSLGRRIKDLINHTEQLMQQNRSLDEADHALQSHIKDIAAEMKPLWIGVQRLRLLSRDRKPALPAE